MFLRMSLNDNIETEKGRSDGVSLNRIRSRCQSMKLNGKRRCAYRKKQVGESLMKQILREREGERGNDAYYELLEGEIAPSRES